MTTKTNTTHQPKNSLELHRQELITKLRENIAALAAMTPEELYEFENSLEMENSYLQKNSALYMLLGNLPLYFTCEHCRAHYGSCPAEEEEEETLHQGTTEEQESTEINPEEHCRRRWLEYGSRG